MSKHGTIRRYTIILENLKKNRFPSFEEIKSHLNKNGFEISPRTLQRDIEHIRLEFGVEIEYQRNRNGYFINTETSLNIESFFRFLEIVNTAELLIESIKESKDTLKHISFEAQGDSKGLENIKPILSAIKRNRLITYKYEFYESGNIKTYSIQPYLLKEYQNRWYVIGSYIGSKKFRTYGLDRITDLQIKTDKFEPLSLDPSHLFENTIGLTYSANTVEDVELKFSALQGKYVKALPFHSSQKIISDDNESLTIQLRINPNFEFCQKVLMLGDSVQVIKPKWLSENIKSTLKAALKNYS